MKTEIEKLTELFSQTFTDFILTNTRAIEWLDEFGYKACVAAIKITAERECDDPLKYTFGVLRSRNKESERKDTPKPQATPMGIYYQNYLKEGELEQSDIDLITRSRNGEPIEADILFNAEYHLRRAVYFKSNNWLPTSANHWETVAWLQMDESERQYATYNDIREKAESAQQAWAKIIQENPQTIEKTFDVLYMIGNNPPQPPQGGVNNANKTSIPPFGGVGGGNDEIGF